MITIEQLLESVDLDFEPRWVTKDEDGNICICDCHKPEPDDVMWDLPIEANYDYFGKIKLAEFAYKDWQECIYEIPRKTTGDIKKIEINPCNGHITALSLFDIALKVNEIIDKIETLEERTEDVCARIIEVERKVL
jgi:hypothetical protein